jgi:hypothetical protein
MVFRDLGLRWSLPRPSPFSQVRISESQGSDLWSATVRAARPVPEWTPGATFLFAWQVGGLPDEQRFNPAGATGSQVTEGDAVFDNFVYFPPESVDKGMAEYGH